MTPGRTRSLRKSYVLPLLLSLVALAGRAGSPAEAQTRAKNPQRLTGWWSRLLTEYLQEVIEFRADGTYTAGSCALSAEMGLCAGPAVPQIIGRYALRGEAVHLDNGLILQKSLDDFGRPGTPRVSLKTRRRESYGWIVRLTPDDPPAGNPPARTLVLSGTDRNRRQYHDFGRAPNPTWQ